MANELLECLTTSVSHCKTPLYHVAVAPTEPNQLQLLKVCFKSCALHQTLTTANEPPDTPIGYSTFVLQRRDDIYPHPSTGFPDYLDFVPERWDHWTPKSWTYIPFNGGPRICIGQQFALTEMAYTVVRILQTYERVDSRQDEFPMFRSDIVLQPAKGVRVAFYQREK